MEDQRVGEIFFDQFNKQGNLDQAIIATRDIMSEEIMDAILEDKNPDSRKRTVLDNINKALGRMGYFIGFDSNVRMQNIPLELYDYFIIIYQTFGEGISYIMNNYAEMTSSLQRNKITKEDLQKSLNSTFQRLAEIQTEFKTSGSITVYKEEIESKREGLNEMVWLILGEEKFISYLEQMNKAVQTLRSYQAQMKMADKNLKNN